MITEVKPSTSPGVSLDSQPPSEPSLTGTGTPKEVTERSVEVRPDPDEEPVDLQPIAEPRPTATSETDSGVGLGDRVPTNRPTG